MSMVLEAVVDRALGQRISREIKRRGWKDREFAAMVDKAPSWVSNLINGHSKSPPDAETTRRIEELLGIPEAEILQAYGYLSKPESDVAQTEGNEALVYTQIADLVDSLDTPEHFKEFVRESLAYARRLREQGGGS